MPRTVRSTNLDLIRWLNNGHESTARKLSFITNASYISRMARGDLEISDRKARSIEKTLELPSGWIDRDNVALLSMSPPEFELHTLVASLPDESKAALLTLLSSKNP